MTELPDKPTYINQTNLEILHKDLIPDCNRTGSYLNFISKYIGELFSRMSHDDIDAFDLMLRSLARSPQPDRVATIHAFEGEHPGLFRRLYGDLLTQF